MSFRLNAPRSILIAVIGSFLLIPVVISQGGNPHYLFAAWAIIITLALLRLCFLNLKKARLIEDTPTSKIRSAAQGYVELWGLAKRPVQQPPLIAPLTQKSCVWYRFTIEKLEQSDRKSQWRVIQSGQSKQMFELDDNTGRCLIDAHNADTSSTHKQCWYSDSRFNTPGSITTSFRGDYRFTEWRIQEDDFLYTLGHLKTYQGPSLLEQIELHRNEILDELKSDTQTLLKRYDSNGDGEISQVEWERARRHAQFTAETVVQKKPPEPQLSILGADSDHGDQPFILSTIDPKFLSRRYRWKAFASAIGFLLGCLGSAWLFHRLFDLPFLT